MAERGRLLHDIIAKRTIAGRTSGDDAELEPYDRELVEWALGERWSALEKHFGNWDEKAVHVVDEPLDPVDVMRDSPIRHATELDPGGSSAFEPWGTPDLLAYADVVERDDVAYVEDLKTGYAELNIDDAQDQMTLLALLAFEAVCDIYEVHVAVVHLATRTRYTGVFREDGIATMRDAVAGIIEGALAPDAPLNPGAVCTLCPAAGVCPAALRELERIPQATQRTDFRALEPQKRSELVEMAKAAKAAAALVEDGAKALLADDPEGIPGWGLRPQNVRNLKDSKRTAAALRVAGAKRDDIEEAASFNVGSTEALYKRLSGLSKKDATKAFNSFFPVEWEERLQLVRRSNMARKK